MLVNFWPRSCQSVSAWPHLLQRFWLDWLVQFLPLSHIVDNIWSEFPFFFCFPHQVAKTKQRIEEETMQVQVVERTQQITLQEQEIIRKEMELEAKVKKPAEAEKYRLEKLAEAQRWVQEHNTVVSWGSEEIWTICIRKSVHLYNEAQSLFSPAACSSLWRLRPRLSPSEWVLPHFLYFFLSFTLLITLHGKCYKYFLLFSSDR